MWGQASNAGDVTAGTAGFGSAVLGSMPTTVITMADLARPAVPSVLNVHDRAVSLPTPHQQQKLCHAPCPAA